jgi:hypothetical protein
MFQTAYAIARQFTWPVVLSRRTVEGVCSSNIGAFVVVNDQGWFVTAFHIVDFFSRLDSGALAARNHESKEQAIRMDQSLDHKARQKALKALGKLDKNATDQCSAWWGRDGVIAQDLHAIPAADIAIGRLEPFDPNWVQTYPTFKDPTKNFEPGNSLCKLGYPFHHIVPIWDVANSRFNLPAGAIPMPLFPIEGILTRFAEIKQPAGGPPPPFPLRLVETSTPGLKGQSGGPTFDTQGTIWAIQVNTAHLPLGFSPDVPGSTKGEKEHQFLNVGRGVHTITIFGLFNQYGVKYNVSTY